MNTLRYFFAAMPFAVSFGGWKLSVVLAEHLGCGAVPNKAMNVCFVGNVDIGPALDAVSWWGMLLWMPCLLVSGVAVGKILAKSFPWPWRNRDRGTP